MKPTIDRLKTPHLWRLLLWVTIFATPALDACAAPVFREEVRAIWVTRWDYKTASDIRRAIRTAADLGLNRVIFQVRGRADAFYRSSYEPWGEEIGGRDPGFDPLQVAVDEARRQSIELDAWINVLPGWKGKRPPRNRRHLYHTHPEWFLTDSKGKQHLLDEHYTIINPCLPEVRTYLVKIVEDLTRNYRFDGLHIDYIRFVAANQKRVDFPHDQRSLHLFRRYSGGTPRSHPNEWDEWRRKSVNTLVSRLAETYREIRPGGRVSVAAIRDYSRARTVLFQDVVTWQRRGWADEVFPMTYTDSTRTFRKYVRAIWDAGPHSTVYPGIGVYLHKGKGTVQLVSQIRAARQMGARGYALFALSNFQATASHESGKGKKAQRARQAMRDALIDINSIAPASARAGK